MTGPRKPFANCSLVALSTAAPLRCFRRWSLMLFPSQRFAAPTRAVRTANADAIAPQSIVEGEAGGCGNIPRHDIPSTVTGTSNPRYSWPLPFAASSALIWKNIRFWAREQKRSLQMGGLNAAPLALGSTRMCCRSLLLPLSRCARASTKQQRRRDNGIQSEPPYTCRRCEENSIRPLQGRNEDRKKSHHLA